MSQKPDDSQLDKKTLTIYGDLHRELKIASAHRGEEIQVIIRKAWECFKKAEGKRLHEPVSLRDSE